MLLSGSDIASVVEANIDPPLLVAERAANALGCSWCIWITHAECSKLRVLNLHWNETQKKWKHWKRLPTSEIKRGCKELHKSRRIVWKWRCSAAWGSAHSPQTHRTQWFKAQCLMVPVEWLNQYSCRFCFVSWLLFGALTCYVFKATCCPASCH